MNVSACFIVDFYFVAFIEKINMFDFWGFYRWIFGVCLV